MVDEDAPPPAIAYCELGPHSTRLESFDIKANLDSQKGRANFDLINVETRKLRIVFALFDLLNKFHFCMFLKRISYSQFLLCC